MKRWISQACLLFFMAIVLRGAAQVYHLPDVNAQINAANSAVENNDAVLMQQSSQFSIPDYRQSLNSPHGHYMDLFEKSVLLSRWKDKQQVEGAPMYDLPQSDSFRIQSRTSHLNAIHLGVPMNVSTFYPVKINGKWGFADQHGRLVVEPLFTDFEGRTSLLDPNATSLQYFKNGSQYVELHGNRMAMFIHPRESETNAVMLHPFMSKGKWGYVDNDGHIKIAPRYERAGIFNGKLAAVLLHHNLYYVKMNGKIAFGGYKLAGTDLERSSFIETKRLQATLKEEAVQGAPIDNK